MKKWLFLVLLEAVTLGLYGQDSPIEPIIKIGVIASFSGEAAAFGESYRNAFALAQEAQGATHFHYSLIYEDFGDSRVKAALAAQKLIQVDHVDCLISFFDAAGVVIAPIARQNKIVHLSLTISPIADGVFNFTDNTMPEDEAPVLIRGFEKRKIKKIVMFTMHDAFEQTINNAIEKSCKESGIEIVGNYFFNPDERNFRMIIAEARSHSPDVYVLNTYSPTLELLTTQLKEAGITIEQMTGIDTGDDAVDPKVYDGLWHVGFRPPEDPFLKNYVERFHTQPKLGTLNAYDMYNLYVKAFEKWHNQGKPTSDFISKELLNTQNFSGVMGPLTVDSKGVFHSQAVEKTFKDGKPVLLDK